MQIDLLFKILGDAYTFFDRRWRSVLAAAILSIGIAQVVGVLIRFAYPLPALPLVLEDGKSLGIDYNHIVEILIFFLASVWFESFTALIARDDILGEQDRFRTVALRATALYPRVLIVNIAAQLAIYMTFLTAWPMLYLGSFGVLFLIPALILAVWFSMVTPVAVLDNVPSIWRTLIRSRILVYRYFWVVLIAMSMGVIPALAIVGIRTDTIYFWPTTIFVGLASTVIGTVVMLSAYLNLRFVKDEIMRKTLAELPDLPPREEAEREAEDSR